MGVIQSLIGPIVVIELSVIVVVQVLICLESKKGPGPKHKK